MSGTGFCFGNMDKNRYENRSGQRCADGSTFEFESVVYRTIVLLFYRIFLDCLFEQLIVRDNVQVYYN